MQQSVNTAPSHSRPAFNIQTQRELVYWAAKLVGELKADAIVACGHSGLVLAGAVGMTAQVPVFAVRTNGERQCSVAASSNVTAYKQDGRAERWVWLDDMYSAGRTFAWSAAECYREGCITKVTPVAALLYRNSRDEPEPVSSYVYSELVAQAQRVGVKIAKYDERRVFRVYGQTVVPTSW